MDSPGPLDRLKDGEHLVRVAILFLAGVLIFVAARSLFVPKGFGEYGHYRAGALLDNRARPAAFAGRAACEECHTDEAQAKKQGRHAGPSCEACHGPLAAHAADPSAMKPTRPDGRALCVTCHATLVGRPAKFPQVDPKEHAPEGACIDCHNPHDPLGDAK